jgi:hypothetical protein
MTIENKSLIKSKKTISIETLLIILSGLAFNAIYSNNNNILVFLLQMPNHHDNYR